MTWFLVSETPGFWFVLIFLKRQDAFSGVFPTDSVAPASSPPYLCRGRLACIPRWSQFDHDSEDYAILVKRMSWFFIIVSRRPFWLIKCWYSFHRLDGVDNAARYAWESNRMCSFACSEKHKSCVHCASLYSSWPSDGFRMTHISDQDFRNLSSHRCSLMEPN